MVKKSIALLAGMTLAGITMCVYGNITHIVVSGTSGEKQNFELSRYNRITFGNTTMSLSSSENPGNIVAELPYAMFNHIEFSDEVLSSIEEILSPDASLIYIPDENALEITADLSEPFTVWILNSSGAIMSRLKTMPGEKLYLKSYTPGMYIAVATANKIQLTKKFIIK